MSRKTKFRRARRRYRKRRGQQGRKKKLSLSLRQARSRKIDNRSERIIVAVSKRIAKAEVRKQHPSLIFRKYIWGNFDADQNLFTGGLAIDWTGDAHHVCQIPIIDMASVQVGAPGPLVLDPDFVMPQENQTLQFNRPFGVNTVAPRFSLDGVRLGYKIKLRSFELEIRAKVERFTAGIMLRESSIVKWALVAVNNDASALQAATFPTDRLLRMRTMGYTGKIDKVSLEKTSKLRHRTLGHGSFKMRVSTLHPNILFKKWRVNLKNRLYEYASDDPLGGRGMSQFGQKVINSKIYLVIRGSLPNDAAFNPYRPTCIAAYKVRYTNVT